MPVPTHVLSCKTWTRNVGCRHCGALVWLFMCTCGSVVLFDERGNGWPQHICSYHRTAPSDSGFRSDAIQRLYRREIDQLRKQLKPSGVQFISIEPSSVAGQTVTAVMVMREMPSRTQRIERFDKLNAIARSAMDINGPAGTYLQITLADSGAEPRSTYPAIVNRSLVDRLELERNALVGATLQARSFGEIAEWFVTEIVALGAE